MTSGDFSMQNWGWIELDVPSGNLIWLEIVHRFNWKIIDNGPWFSPWFSSRPDDFHGLVPREEAIEEIGIQRDLIIQTGGSWSWHQEKIMEVFWGGLQN